MISLDSLKTVYGFLGAKHPTLSLVIVSIVGALVFGGSWVILGHLYRFDLATKVTIPTQVRATDCSAANTGNGASITVTCDHAPEPKKEPK